MENTELKPLTLEALEKFAQDFLVPVFDGINNRLDKIDERLDNIDRRVDNLEMEMKSRFSDVDSELFNIKTELKELKNRFTMLETRTEEDERAIITDVGRLESRLKKLEASPA